MLERFVENWLDNADERGYQHAFLQILLHEKHKIHHSTRHGPLEFGKDIISKNQDGRLCAFQLKANPGGRLTKAQFRELIPQLNELIHYAVPMETAGGAHESYLVTNGRVEEETREAARLFNEGLSSRLPKWRRLSIVDRDDLLARAQALYEGIWPKELQELDSLLKLLTGNPRADLSPELIQAFLGDALGLPTGDGALHQGVHGLKADRLRRGICSAGLMLSIGLSRHRAKENHWAQLAAWVFYCGLVVAACERQECSFERNGRASFDVARQEILRLLGCLWGEIKDQPDCLEDDVLSDIFVVQKRRTLLAALMSVLWFVVREAGAEDGPKPDEIGAFLRSSSRYLDLWGEAAVPQLIAIALALQDSQGGIGGESLVTSLLDSLLTRSRRGEAGLASPYYGCNDVLHHELAQVIPGLKDPIIEREALGMSYFTGAAFDLLVRANRKDYCKRIWPPYSKIAQQEFVVAKSWMFPLFRTDDGTLKMTILPDSTSWAAACDEAASVETPLVPKALQDDREILMLLSILMPHRVTRPVVRRLAWLFEWPWLIPTGRPKLPSEKG